MSKVNPFHPRWLQIALNKWCPGWCCTLIRDTQGVWRCGCRRAGYSHKCPWVLGVPSCLPRTWPSCSWEWGVPSPLHHTRPGLSPRACGVPVGLRGFRPLACGLFHSSTHCQRRDLPGLALLRKRWQSATHRLVFQEELWGFPWRHGSRWHAAHGREIGTRCSSRTTVVNNRELRRIYMIVHESCLRVVRVCSVIQLQKYTNTCAW